MVTGTHPEEIELFDYVEGDLRADRRAALEVHLASCAQCSEEVARVQAARQVLRESQFLQLPPRRREGVFLNLPEQRRAPGRSPALSPKQLLAVLTPIAVVAAIVVALVTSGGFKSGGEEAGSAGGGAQEAAGTTNAAQDSAAEKALAPAFRVGGSPTAVAAELRRKGFDARAAGNRVEVRNATRAELRRALGDRQVLSARDVEIVVVR
jgi:anti-sigma factor RsiW